MPEVKDIDEINKKIKFLESSFKDVLRKVEGEKININELYTESISKAIADAIDKSDKTKKMNTMVILGYVQIALHVSLILLIAWLAE